MAWTTPPTFAANASLSAADLNASLRDCMNETMPAKATDPGSYFVTSAANTLAQRKIQQATVFTSETRTSTTYGDLATVGPSITFSLGNTAKVVIVVTCQLSNNTVGAFSRMSYAVSGATTIAADDIRALAWENAGSTQAMATSYVTFQTLNSGSNTITAKYRVGSGTGTFLRRRLLIMPF